jgi:hypothetical protein
MFEDCKPFSPTGLGWGLSSSGLVRLGSFFGVAGRGVGSHLTPSGTNAGIACAFFRRHHAALQAVPVLNAWTPRGVIRDVTAHIRQNGGYHGE